ncbi:hypothetical protein [Lyngbya aestuarii]|uniref:hypothetical protein n=1 Tax=Lyngbya aestuarii TaxID=118322 RepID=UPI00403E22C4
MQKIKLINKVIIGAILCLALAPQAKQIAQEAPPKVFLLRLPCANSGIGNWAGQNQNVSVGRAFYQSRMYMGPGDRSASITCQIQPNKGNVTFQKLQLGFGMRDNDQGSSSVAVNVYLDGVKAETRTISPGEEASVSLDVTSTSNISIEAQCSSTAQYCQRIYFWDASLEVAPPSPQQSS